MLGLTGDGCRQTAALPAPAAERAVGVAPALGKSELGIVVIDKYGGITVRFASVIFTTRHIRSTKALLS